MKNRNGQQGNRLGMGQGVRSRTVSRVVSLAMSFFSSRGVRRVPKRCRNSDVDGSGIHREPLTY